MNARDFYLDDNRKWRVGLVLVWITAFLLHFDAINIGLIFDDRFAVQANDALLNGFDLKKILLTNFWGNNSDFSIAAWRPLVTLSYALNFAVHGSNPMGYHLVNLLLHATVSLQVALLAESMGVSRLGALAAALLFAVHPIHLEAVMPIVGRADLMLGVFGISALLLQEKGRSLPALICLILALYSKEMGIVIAAVMVWRKLTRTGKMKIPAWLTWIFPLIISALWLVSRILVLGRLGESFVGYLENPLANADFMTRFWTAGALYIKALGLMFFPRTLLREYSYPVVMPVTGISVAAAIGHILLLSTLVAVVYFSKKRNTAISTSLALWSGGFLLLSHLGPKLPMIFAERVFYLPSAGFIIAVLSTLETQQVRSVRTRFIIAFVAVAVVAFAVRSVFRAKDWSDESTIIEAALRDEPNCIKTLLLAVSHLNPNGKISDAESLRLLKNAVALKSDHSLPHIELAKFYISKDLRKEALLEIRKAEALSAGDFDLAPVRCGYAARYDQSNALEYCQTAVQKNPDDPINWSFLGIALDKLGNPAEADKSFRRALKAMMSPRSDVLLNYAVFLAAHGRYTPAEEMFRAVLQINPKDSDAAAYLKELEKLKLYPTIPNR